MRVSETSCFALTKSNYNLHQSTIDINAQFLENLEHSFKN